VDSEYDQSLFLLHVRSLSQSYSIAIMRPLSRQTRLKMRTEIRSHIMRRLYAIALRIRSSTSVPFAQKNPPEDLSSGGQCMFSGGISCSFPFP
ncbi:MAG: hypothetical protein IJB41_01235, partial [Clostridia bacterium]|nr:hypothetical protein [Clostridia bacterium]